MKKISKLIFSLLLCSTLCTGFESCSDTDNKLSKSDDGGLIEDVNEVVVSLNRNYAYGRVVESDDGTLIATGEQLSGYDSGIPIYRSSDGGATWNKNQKNIHDHDYNNGAYDAKWQPTLYVLPQDVGTTLKKGDIMLVATSIDAGADNYNLVSINLYRSTDIGLTWTWMSEIQSSTRDSTHNGCWEGNLYVNDNGELVCIFADETLHDVYNQRIVLRTTTDGVNWSEIQNVIALEDQYNLRPGMPVVTKIKDGKYFLVTEMVGESGVPIYWRTSDDGINWGDANWKGNLISVNDKITDLLSGREMDTVAFPGSSPYAVWTPKGGANGTLYVTSQRTNYTQGSPADRAVNNMFVSYDLGATWQKIKHPLTYTQDNNMRPAYSNSMTISNDGNYMYVVNTMIVEEVSMVNNVLVFTKAKLK